MDYILVVIYAIANFFYWIWCWRKYGKLFSPGMVLVFFYTFIACVSIPAYLLLPHESFFQRYDFSNITFVPYVFLFFIVYMFIKPVFAFNSIIKKAQFNMNLKRVRILVYCYVICAFVSTFLYWRTLGNISVEDMGEIRNDVYNGNVINAYNNLFERFFLSITSYLNVPMVIIFFTLLAKYRLFFSRNFFLLLGMSLLVSSIGDSIRTVSRGVLINLFMELALTFSFYLPFFSKKKIMYVLFVSGLLIVAIIYISQMLTVSRFGEGESCSESVICYWGQPPIIFNSQVVDIEEYALGQYFFYPVSNALGEKPGLFLAKQGKAFDPCFTTFVGGLYRDGGPLLVILLAYLIPKLILKIVDNKRIGIPELYVMLFYCLSIEHGALVTKFGYCYDVFVCMIIYFFLKCLTLNPPVEGSMERKGQ